MAARCRPPSAASCCASAPLVDGVALLASADARPAPRSATLTVRRDLFSVEALFTHADGSFWRRHFTARFLPDGVDVIVWVFDAAGTRAPARWRGLWRVGGGLWPAYARSVRVSRVAVRKAMTRHWSARPQRRS